MVNLKKELLSDIEMISKNNKYSMKNNILINRRIWVAHSNFFRLYLLIDVKREI